MMLGRRPLVGFHRYYAPDHLIRRHGDADRHAIEPTINSTLAVAISMAQEEHVERGRFFDAQLV